MFDQKTLDWFDRQNVDRPVHLSHQVTDTPENPLSNQLQRVKINSWHLDGDQLIADTDQGPLVQKIPTSHILVGTDDKNLPIFKRVEV